MLDAVFHKLSFIQINTVKFDRTSELRPKASPFVAILVIVPRERLFDVKEAVNLYERIEAENIQDLCDQLGNLDENVTGATEDISSIRCDIDELKQAVQGLEETLERQQEALSSCMEEQLLNLRAQRAETSLIRIQQELAAKFGRHVEIRKVLMGILQSMDLGIVRREAVTEISEQYILKMPGYWLAPCLVALAKWITDEPEAAGRAVQEAMRRNREKTVLLFTLICHRAGRQGAVLPWLRLYLEMQDESKLDHKAIIFLNAYACGLLGRDSENVIARLLDQWMERLQAQPGMEDKQDMAWKKILSAIGKPLLPTGDYEYLRKFCHAWLQLEDVMRGAMWHKAVYQHLQRIFDCQSNSSDIAGQLDDILEQLVTEPEVEEAALQQKAIKAQAVAEYREVDRRIPKNKSNLVRKNFLQLMTEAVSAPYDTQADIATQKIFIAMSKEPMQRAYASLVARNRSRIPDSIGMKFPMFQSSTKDGADEEAIIADFTMRNDEERAEAKALYVLSRKEMIFQYLGILPLVLGCYLLGIWGMVIGGVCGAAMTYTKWYLPYRAKVEKCQQLDAEYDEKANQAETLIRAFCAEVVDFRTAFAASDAESSQVAEFLSALSPAQSMIVLPEMGRRVQLRNGGGGIA